MTEPAAPRSIGRASEALRANLRAPDPALEADIRRRLEDVEAELGRAVASDIELVNAASAHLLLAGGKRFRPMLVLLGGAFGPRAADASLVPGAVAIELTHLASLHHDDVIDEADSRRGIPSVNARWGNTVAVLTGDFLFARASEIAAALGPEVSRLLAATITRVCEGQIMELEVAGRVDVSRDEYLAVIRRKTASLIATSCRLGGMLAGADAPTLETLERFGTSLGLAFQLSDDIMDLASDEATLGKAPGVDLREGVYTLPVIFALGGRRGDDLRALLGTRPLRPEDVGRVLDVVRSDGALDRARAAVSQVVRSAVAEASALPGGRERDALVHLAEFLAERCGAAA